MNFADTDLELLMRDLESDLVERKSSASDRDKIREAICAYANDLPNHNKPGVIFIGIHDDGSCANLPITDQLILTLSDMRSDGNILPIPSISVQKRQLNGCALVVVTVLPSDAPPVRFKGRTYVRIGSRKGIATPEEERRLSEKRRSRDLPFDLNVLSSASLTDLNLHLFKTTYLPSALAPEILLENNRTIEQQLSSLRFISPEPDAKPTVLGILVVGNEPRQWLPGAYVQFLRIDGGDLTDPIKDQKELGGPLTELLRILDDTMAAHISVATDLVISNQEIKYPDYPLPALQQLVRNAVMHRSYEGTNSPIRITWFNDRIEIQNPGGPFGLVTKQNFGQSGITDYRNPHLAEALKNLGFVQRFGVGIQLARKQLEKNGNPPLEFYPEDTHVLAVVRRKV